LIDLVHSCLYVQATASSSTRTYWQSAAAMLYTEGVTSSVL